VLTINGVSELVVQSAESYQQLLDRLEHLEAAQGIREGLKESDQGQGKPAIAALQKKLDGFQPE